MAFIRDRTLWYLSCLISLSTTNAWYLSRPPSHFLLDKDIGPFTNNGGNHDTLINRGYQTRTSECFGFNKDNEEWYVWQDESSAFYDEKTETDESDHDLVETGSGAVQIAIPNSGPYGYDRYLSQTSYNYEGVLSISPVGMFVLLRLRLRSYFSWLFCDRRFLNIFLVCRHGKISLAPATTSQE